MKQYKAEPRALQLTQIATPILAGIIITLLWVFLQILPTWLLWFLTVILLLASIVLALFYLPLWFKSLEYNLSDTYITQKFGIFFTQRRTMRLTTLQFVTIFRTPLRGMNFILLHTYGGSMLILFLNRRTAEELHHTLQEAVIRNRAN